LITNATPVSGGLSLANWLAQNFPYLYGANAPTGDNLTNASNATVAALFQTFFGESGQKTDAQIMAGALASWFTDTNLNANTASLASKFNFKVEAGGSGSLTYNVGSNGTAIGLSNNTSYTIIQLLQQVNLDRKANGGTLTSDEFNAFNTIFDAINQKGDIS
jgi:hypothetical protein